MSSRSDPIKDSAFEAFGIIAPGSRHAFRKLNSFVISFQCVQWSQNSLIQRLYRLLLPNLPSSVLPDPEPTSEALERRDALASP